MPSFANRACGSLSVCRLRCVGGPSVGPMPTKHPCGHEHAVPQDEAAAKRLQKASPRNFASESDLISPVFAHGTATGACTSRECAATMWTSTDRMSTSTTAGCRDGGYEGERHL